MPAPNQSQIAAVRRFNRFYTREVGVLRKNFLDSPWTLTEMRVLFERDGLVARTRSAEDARVSFLSLSAKGEKQFEAANARQVAQTTSMLGRLKPPDRTRLTSAMQMIEDLLAHGGAKAEIRLRDPAPGDFGWMVERHAILYREEYGWREKFEGVCARIVADFIEHFDPKLEKCWIAEMAGQRVGCVMLVKDDPKAKKADVSRIRLLLLEPQARGQGLGRRLVEECVAFSRAKGYARVTLWTHKELTAARAIYAKLGFKKTGEESHDDWGGRATSEFWDLDL
jgi:ribosomal protein S18 acetylase RimI-like enzyme